MAQLKFHIGTPPPGTNLTILQKLIGAYKVWHETVRHFPKTARYTLGGRIDALFIETAESAIVASYLAGEEKLPYIQKASLKLDTLEFFLQVAWEIKSLDDKRYIALSERLAEIGRMLGGWKKTVETTKQRTP